MAQNCDSGWESILGEKPRGWIEFAPRVKILIKGGGGMHCFGAISAIAIAIAIGIHVGTEASDSSSSLIESAKNSLAGPDRQQMAW